MTPATLVPSPAAGRLAAACLLLAPAAHAQEWRIVPQLTLNGTYSDNVALAPPDRSRSGFIADLAPELRIEGNGPRLRLFLDTSFHVLRHSTEKQLDSIQRFADGLARLEAVEHWLYVDARTSVTQQTRNPLGPATTPDAPSNLANRVETRISEVAPFIRGYLGEFAHYRVQVRASHLQTQDDAIPPTRTYDASARLLSASPSAIIGWSADASTLSMRNADVGTLQDNRVRAAGIFTATPLLRLSVITGYDDTDFAAEERKSGGVVGAGLDWNPSPRTQATAVYEHRFFGETHDVQLHYRTPRTAWRASSVRDLTMQATLLSGPGFGSSLALMSDLLASALRDPDARESAARGRLESAGIAGSPPLSSTFLTSRPILYRENLVAGIYTGVRDTLTVRYDNRAQRATGPAPAVPSTPASNTDNEQRRWSAQWAHQLTPLTSIALAYTGLRTRALAPAQGESRQREFTTTWTTRLGRRLLGSVGLRHVVFDTSTQAGYRENAVFCLLTARL